MYHTCKHTHKYHEMLNTNTCEWWIDITKKNDQSEDTGGDTSMPSSQREIGSFLKSFILSKNAWSM